MDKTIEEKIAISYYANLERHPKVVLRLLDEKGPMGVENLSSDTKTSRIQTKDIIIQLQGLGYVERAKSVKGEKYVLTKEGEQYGKDCMDKLSNVHTEL